MVMPQAPLYDALQTLTLAVAALEDAHKTKVGRHSTESKRTALTFMLELENGISLDKRDVYF